MAEEFDLHLLELAGAEGEVPRRDLVAEALAHLGDAEGDAHPGAVQDIFEVDEDALGGFRPQEGGIVFAPQGADDGLEHEVEFPRLGQGAQRFGVGAQHRGELGRGDGSQRDQVALPVEFVGVLGAEVEKLEGLLLGVFRPRRPARLGGHERPPPLGLDPAALHLVEAVAAFRLAAIDHVVVEEVVMARALPHLRVHDDGAVDAGHFKGRGGPGRGLRLVMGGDHVAPPGLADVSLQLDPQRAIVPKALQPAVNLARLKEKSPPPAQGDQLFHFHGESTLPEENGRSSAVSGRVGRAQRAPPPTVRPFPGGARCARPTLHVHPQQKPTSVDRGPAPGKPGRLTAPCGAEATCGRMKIESRGRAPSDGARESA